MENLYKLVTTALHHKQSTLHSFLHIHRLYDPRVLIKIAEFIITNDNLFWACKNGFIPLVKFLVKQKARLDYMDVIKLIEKSENIPVLIQAFHIIILPESHFQIPCAAIKTGNTDLVKLLINRMASEINWLERMIDCNARSMIEYFVEKGGLVVSQNCMWYAYCVGKGNTELYRYLYSYIDRTDDWTKHMVNIVFSHPVYDIDNIVDFLVERRIPINDTNRGNNLGFVILQAIKNSHKSLIKYMVDIGITIDREHLYFAQNVCKDPEIPQILSKHLGLTIND